MRKDIESTLNRRCFNIVYPLGDTFTGTVTGVFALKGFASKATERNDVYGINVKKNAFGSKEHTTD